MHKFLDLAAIAAGLGVTKRAVELRSTKENWPFEERTCRGGKKRFYILGALPSEVQAALLLRSAPAPVVDVEPAASIWSPMRAESVWAIYNAASDEHKARAAQRLRALHAIEALRANGTPLMQARAQVALQLQREGERASVASLMRWTDAVKDAPASSWLALLLPAYVAGQRSPADCDPQAWDWYKGHYLTRAKPSHASTYRRLQEMAQSQGWTIPCGKTLERRMDREVEARTQRLMREGTEAVARTLPHSVRSTDHFAAGEAVNGDGLKFDRLWVRFEDGEILNTATAWFWQDLRTRRILAWRLGKTENTDLFRLATYDMTAICAPSRVYIDNTRVAANKAMTAGADNRWRYKSDPKDGIGLLQMLGMTPCFTNPDHETGNPGAKPIERAFRVDGLHGEVATHPNIIGRGYSRATAIDVAELREVIGIEVARHNARTGRRTEACRGALSFDQAWDEATAHLPPCRLTRTQRDLLLTCRESVTVNRSGFVGIQAGRSAYGQNRYWSEHLARYARHKVVVHYDPENLHADAHIYGLDGRYLCAAQHMATYAFDSKQAGDEVNKLRKRVVKATKTAAVNTTRMTELERKHLYQAATGVAPPEEPRRKRGKGHRDGNVTRANFRQVPNPARDARRAALARTGTDDAPPREARLDDYLKRLQQQQIADSGWSPPKP